MCDEHKNPFLACCFSFSTFKPKAATLPWQYLEFCPVRDSRMVSHKFSWRELVSHVHSCSISFFSPLIVPHDIELLASSFPGWTLNNRILPSPAAWFRSWSQVFPTLATYLTNQKELDSLSWVGKFCLESPAYYLIPSYENTEPKLSLMAWLSHSQQTFLMKTSSLTV